MSPLILYYNKSIIDSRIVFNSKALKDKLKKIVNFLKLFEMLFQDLRFSSNILQKQLQHFLAL